MTALSKRIGINRQNLYRTFASTGNPKFRSLGAILKGLGYKLAIADSAGLSSDHLLVQAVYFQKSILFKLKEVVFHVLRISFADKLSNLAERQLG